MKLRLGRSNAVNRSRLLGLIGGAALVAALIAPSVALGAGPGNNGLDATGNGTKSNATVGGSLADAGNSVDMGTATLSCQGDSAGSVAGSFTLTKDLDVGSKITVYLVPNNGSNATPEGNVAKNETTITLGAGNHTSGSVINWSITVTHAFTVDQGGILGVFAVNDDGVTALSSSKTNSLNCTESTPSSPPSAPPSSPPSAPPSAPPSQPPPPDDNPPSNPPSTPPSVAPSGSVGGETSAPSEGGVEGETDVPAGPQTDIGDNTAGPGSSLPLLLVVLGIVGLAAVVLTPARGRRR